jgi:hypothetical protein
MMRVAGPDNAKRRKPFLQMDVVETVTIVNKFKLEHFVAMLLIGDGVMALIRPEHDAAAWSHGPWLWREGMRYLRKNPTTTRLVATAQIVVGLWWLLRKEKDARSEIRLAA